MYAPAFKAGVCLCDIQFIQVVLCIIYYAMVYNAVGVKHRYCQRAPFAAVIYTLMPARLWLKSFCIKQPPYVVKGFYVARTKKPLHIVPLALATYCIVASHTNRFGRANLLIYSVYFMCYYCILFVPIVSQDVRTGISALYQPLQNLTILLPACSRYRRTAFGAVPYLLQLL